MPESNRLKKTLHQWGGANATFFTYTHLSHDLCTGLLPALLPMIKIGLELSYLQSGLLLSAFTITSGLSQFPGGWLGDRFSRPLVITLGLIGVSLAALAVGLSSTYYLILVILVIMGIFSGAYHPSATSLISSYFGTDRRGKVIALHMVGGSVGFTLGPVLGGLIAKALGWHFAYIFLSIPTLLAALFVWLKFGRHPIVEIETEIGKNPAGKSYSVPPKMGLLQVLRPIAVVTALSVATQLVAGTAIAFFPVYLVDRHQIAPAVAAMLMGVIRGGGIFGSLFGGWLSDHWGRRNAILITLAATGPILYLSTRLPFNPASVLVFVLFGSLLYMRQATTQPILMDSVPAHLRSTIFGIYFGMSMEGTSLLQPVAGYFMDLYDIVTVFNVVALISIGLSVIAFFTIKSLKLPH